VLFVKNEDGSTRRVPCTTTDYDYRSALHSVHNAALGSLISDGSTFFRFDGHCWISQTDMEVQRHMQHWLRHVLTHFNVLLRYEQSCLDDIRGGTPEAKEITKVCNVLAKARTFVDTEQKLKNLTYTVKRETLKPNIDKLMDR